MRGSKWGAITVKKTLQSHFNVGQMAMRIPLSSLRMQRRLMQRVVFEPGVLGAIFSVLHLKVQQ